jgi:hypothetical protein
MREMRNAREILVEKPEGKRHLGRSRRRWDYNIRVVARDIGWEGLDWICLVLDRDQWRVLVNTVMYLRIIKFKIQNSISRRPLLHEVN